MWVSSKVQLVNAPDENWTTNYKQNRPVTQNSRDTTYRRRIKNF